MTIRSRNFCSLKLAVVAALTCMAAPQVASAAGPSVGGPANVSISVSKTVNSSLPGQTQAGNTFQVRAHVPLACWVRPDNDIVAETGIAGGVYEACNNPGGFVVTASYRPLSGAEKAELFYDNRAFELNTVGTQVLRHSSMATIKRVNYRFGEVSLDSPLTLSLTIQPI